MKIGASLETPNDIHTRSSVLSVLTRRHLKAFAALAVNHLGSSAKNETQKRRGKHYRLRQGIGWRYLWLLEIWMGKLEEMMDAATVKPQVIFSMSSTSALLRCVRLGSQSEISG